MAREEHEYGTLQFTQTGYMSLVRDIRVRYNNYISQVFKASVAVHAILNTITGGTKSKRQREVFEQFTTGEKQFSDWTLRDLSISAELWDHIERELFRGDKQSLCKPRQLAFKKFTNKQTEFSLPHTDEFSVTLRASSRTLKWDVSRGNHAVRDSHRHPVAQVMFEALAEHKWRRGEGGIFWSSDEYAEDSSQSQGICHEMEASAVYGPEGEAEQSRHLDMRLSRFRGKHRPR